VGAALLLGLGPIIGVEEVSDVGERDTTEAVRLLAALLPFWTIRYGKYIDHFWALPKNSCLASASHIESSAADELEQQTWKVERAFLAQPVRRRPARPILRAR
jgi:hypothetical protein